MSATLPSLLGLSGLVLGVAQAWGSSFQPVSPDHLMAEGRLGNLNVRYEVRLDPDELHITFVGLTVDSIPIDVMSDVRPGDLKSFKKISLNRLIVGMDGPADRDSQRLSYKFIFESVDAAGCDDGERQLIELSYLGGADHAEVSARCAKP